jgi:hypothetical protein
MQLTRGQGEYFGMAAGHTQFSTVSQLGLDREQLAKLQSWAGAVASELRKGAPVRIGSKGEIRIGSKGSLAIYTDGGWQDYAAGIGGRDVCSLLLHLLDASPAEARRYAIRWLATHPGSGGGCTRAPLDESEIEARDARYADYAQQVLRTMVTPAAETATGKYLTNRQLDGELPECVGHLAVGRGHESAIVGVLTADGEVVGVQLGHLTALGDKSTYEPQRNIYAIDKVKAKSAAFRIPASPLPDAGTLLPDEMRQLVGTRVACEGLEDALSIQRAIPFVEICGVPGIGRLQHLQVKKGERILVFADGDAADSEAAKALTKATDYLLSEGAAVTVARPPIGTDANTLLCEGGPSAVLSVALSATPATLSPKGRIARLSRLHHLDYEQARRAAAKELGIRPSALDREVAQLRKDDEVEEGADDSIVPKDVPWPGPITNIAAVCDEALAKVQRYVVADADDLAVQVIWSLGAHFVHHATICLTRYARLEIGGEDVEVGKTTLLNVTGVLVPRALPVGGAISAAAYYRAVDQHQAAVLIDEAHDLFKAKDGSQSHLLRILRSGHTRNFAFVLLTEPSPDGRHVLRRFSTWTPIAYTVIGQLPDAGTRGRSISIRLVRALEGEVTADFDEGDSPVLGTIRQKFSRWAADQDALPLVPRPQGLFNRRWNNWAPLLRVAMLVGGEWPERIRRAVQRALVAPAPTNSDGAVALLTDIRIAFTADRMESQQLCNLMLALVEPSAEWSRIHKGREITPYSSASGCADC